MRKLSVFLGVAVWAIGSAVSAQEVDSTATMQMSSWRDENKNEIAEYIPDISLDARFGYGHDFSNGADGFLGNGLFIDINGKISKHFSYSLNHRIADFEGEDKLGFGNTNWLTLTYENDHFYVTAGAEDIKVGSFEYDAYDLDSYWEMNSLFWNTFSPWHWGISAGWYPVEGQTIILQTSQSPFFSRENPDLFAYAVAWRGEWNCYESYWSANLWQHPEGGYVESLNLGNRFHFGDFSFDLDYLTRAKSIKHFFTSDISVMFSPSYEWEWGRAFAKVGWEKVAEDYLGYDFIGDNLFYGAGVEFFPLKSQKDVRLHAIWAANTAISNSHYINIGLTWKFNLTRAGKALLNRLNKKAE